MYIHVHVYVHNVITDLTLIPFDMHATVHVKNKPITCECIMHTKPQ